MPQKLVNMKVTFLNESMGNLKRYVFKNVARTIFNPLGHIQLKLTCVATCFALPPHKKMCPNDLLNQIAIVTARKHQLLLTRSSGLRAITSS